MRTQLTTIILICVILLLALAPWIVQCSSPTPLVPDELVQKQDSYEEIVATVRAATLEASRNASSTYKVVNIDSVKDETNVNYAASTDVLTTSNFVTTSTQTPMATATNVVIIIRSDPELTSLPKSSTLTPTTEPTPTPEAIEVSMPLSLSQHMAEVQDIITEEMLDAQVAEDAKNLAISNLEITFTPYGIHASGKMTTFLIKVPIEAWGTFEVEEHSLVAKVDCILLGGNDVTDQYRAQLEDTINSNLYRLLPERYVQSYETSYGQVVVYSRTK